MSSTPEEHAPPRLNGPSSRAREHLANERTFLAWVRTSLGLIGLGFVLARMGLFLRQLAISTTSTPLHSLRTGREFIITGVIFLLLGTILCGGAGWLYRKTRIAIDTDRYEPAGGAVLTLTVVVVVGGLLIAGLVLGRTMTADGP